MKIFNHIYPTKKGNKRSFENRKGILVYNSQQVLRLLNQFLIIKVSIMLNIMNTKNSLL